MAGVPGQPERTDVLVVGSGPTGLMAAIRLSAIRSGIGQNFPGTAYPSQFVLADVELIAVTAPYDEVTINMYSEASPSSAACRPAIIGSSPQSRGLGGTAKP